MLNVDVINSTHDKHDIQCRYFKNEIDVVALLSNVSLVMNITCMLSIFLGCDK